MNLRLVRPPGRRILGPGALVFALVIALAPTLARAAFDIVQIASGLDNPVNMAVAPDGRVFIALQSGSIRIVKNGTLLPTPFLTVSTDGANEEGLLGLALDPSFATNNYVYINYTATMPTRRNRIERYTANGDVAEAGSALPLYELDENLAQFHIGGSLQFGVDGKLYVGTGDNTTQTNSQSLSITHGKLLRLNRDGTIPADNPTFGGLTSGKYRAIWALGLRNPFSFAVQPGTGRIFINDVGFATYEEVNDAIAGANFGWPTTEGPTPPGLPGVRYPVHHYTHAAQACAITGGTFYDPSVSQFPAQFVGRYFYVDFCVPTIYSIDPAAPATAEVVLSNLVAGPVALRTAADGALYYLARGTAADGSPTVPVGELLRITESTTGAPSINSHPAPQIVPVGATATFSVTATGSPPLRYQWLRADTDIVGASSASYTTPATTLGNTGSTFRCRVSNDNGTVTSNPATLTVVRGLAPTPSIDTPVASAQYRGGDILAFSGSATDNEDGSLGASALSWRIDFHHAEHTHPGLPVTSGISSGAFEIPRLGETATDVFYRIILEATDSTGLSTTVTRDVQPVLGSVRFETVPPNLPVEVDTQLVTTPADITGVVGIVRELRVESPQRLAGVSYEFTGWSDGGAAAHDITFPDEPTTFVASFVARRPLSLTRLACHFRFDRSGRDRCNVRGVLRNVPAGFAPTGQSVSVDIGGAQVPFTLDGRGRAAGPQGSLIVDVPKGFAGGALNFRARLRNGSWAAAFADEGILANSTVRNRPVDLNAEVPFAGTSVHSASVVVSYRGRAGKRGRFRLVPGR